MQNTIQMVIFTGNIQLRHYEILNDIYKLTYKPNKGSTHAYEKYSTLIPHRFGAYVRHRCAFSNMPTSTVRGLKRMQLLRSCADLTLLKPNSTHLRFDMYQVGCIKYLARLRYEKGFVFTAQFLAKWVGVSSQTLGAIKNNPDITEVPCTLFDLRTDLRAMGTPKRPTELRIASNNEANFVRQVDTLKHTSIFASLKNRGRKRKSAMT